MYVTILLMRCCTTNRDTYPRIGTAVPGHVSRPVRWVGAATASELPQRYSRDTCRHASWPVASGSLAVISWPAPRGHSRHGRLRDTAQYCVNISLLGDALVCLIPIFFTPVFRSVLPYAKQKLAVVRNVSRTIVSFFQHKLFSLLGRRLAVNRKNEARDVEHFANTRLV